MVGFRTKTPFGYGEYLRASFYTGMTVEEQKERSASVEKSLESVTAAGMALDIEIGFIVTVETETEAGVRFSNTATS